MLYALTPSAHVYAMWGTSFDPSAESLSLSASTADLAPEHNQTVEAGLKWSPRPALLLSGALFRTIQFNSREPSPTDPTLTILAGTARSEGLELLAQGQVTARWLVLGGYTYLDAKIVASPDADVGQPLQNAPRHNLRLFSSYDLSSRLTVGGGLDYASSRVPSSTPDPNGQRQSVPGFTTLSALVRYRLSPHVALQLNADNSPTPTTTTASTKPRQHRRRPLAQADGRRRALSSAARRPARWATGLTPGDDRGRLKSRNSLPPGRRVFHVKPEIPANYGDRP